MKSLIDDFLMIVKFEREFNKDKCFEIKKYIRNDRMNCIVLEKTKKTEKVKNEDYT